MPIFHADIALEKTRLYRYRVCFDEPVNVAQSGGLNILRHALMHTTQCTSMRPPLIVSSSRNMPCCLTSSINKYIDYFSEAGSRARNNSMVPSDLRAADDIIIIISNVNNALSRSDEATLRCATPSIDTTTAKCHGATIFSPESRPEITGWHWLPVIYIKFDNFIWRIYVACAFGVNHCRASASRSLITGEIKRRAWNRASSSRISIMSRVVLSAAPARQRGKYAGYNAQYRVYRSYESSPSFI